MCYSCIIDKDFGIIGIDVLYFGINIENARNEEDH